MWPWTVDALMCLQEVKDIGRSCKQLLGNEVHKNIWVCSLENMPLKRPIPASTQPGNPGLTGFNTTWQPRTHRLGQSGFFLYFFPMNKESISSPDVFQRQTHRGGGAGGRGGGGGGRWFAAHPRDTGSWLGLVLWGWVIVNVTQGLQPGDHHTGSREARQWVGFMLETHISISEVNVNRLRRTVLLLWTAVV